MHNSAPDLAAVVDAGVGLMDHHLPRQYTNFPQVRTVIYDGDADFICNYMGFEAMVSHHPSISLLSSLILFALLSLIRLTISKPNSRLNMRHKVLIRIPLMVNQRGYSRMRGRSRTYECLVQGTKFQLMTILALRLVKLLHSSLNRQCVENHFLLLNINSLGLRK